MRPSFIFSVSEKRRKLSNSENKILRDFGPLRWQHVTFYLYPGGVAADVTFVYIKGNTSQKLAITD
jgi:hypothetical protein